MNKSGVILVGGLLFAVVVYFLYLLIRGVNPIVLLKASGTEALFLSFLLLLLGMVVRAFRLYQILRVLGTRISFRSSLIARFTGNFAGLITPGNLGAEPVRVLTIASLNGIPLESVMAAGVLESFYDSVILALVAFFASFFYLPSSLLVFLVSIVVLALWSFGLLGFVYKESFWRRIIERIAGKRLSDEIAEELYRRYKFFASLVKLGISKRLHAEAIPLTFFALYFIVISFFPLGHKSLSDLSFFLNSFIAYSMSFTMSVVPTPGGSGFFEYGLDVVLPSDVVALWRLVFILTTIIPAAIILAFMVKMRSLLYENIRKSVFFMGEKKA